MSETSLGGKIQPVYDLRATAVASGTRHRVRRETVEQRVRSMMAYVASEGRLFALKPSEWGMLLVGVTLCGFATLLF
jgi:hypothetical protein